MGKWQGPRKTVWWTFAVLILTQAARPIGNSLMDGGAVNAAASVVTLGALCFLAGLIVQDFYNPTSWVRHNWRILTAAFSVDVVDVREMARPHRYEALVRITVRRAVESGTLSVLAYACTGQPNVSISLMHLRGETREFHKGEVVDLVLAVIPIIGGGWTIAADNEWKDFDPSKEKRWLLEASNNIVEVSLGKGWRKQRERFELRMPSSKNWAARSLYMRWQRDGAYDVD